MPAESCFSSSAQPVTVSSLWAQHNINKAGCVEKTAAPGLCALRRLCRKVDMNILQYAVNY